MTTQTQTTPSLKINKFILPSLCAIAFTILGVALAVLGKFDIEGSFLFQEQVSILAIIGAFTLLWCFFVLVIRNYLCIDTSLHVILSSYSLLISSCIFTILTIGTVLSTPNTLTWPEVFSTLLNGSLALGSITANIALITLPSKTN